MKRKNSNIYLVIAAACTATAALAHLGCIVFGGDWYRFFGAGEQMAQLAEQGHPYPAIVTGSIVAVLATWSLYALSGAGLIPRLPLLRSALTIIAAIFILRGAGAVVLVPLFPGNSTTFWFVSSSICLSIGLFYAIGVYRGWRTCSI